MGNVSLEFKTGDFVPTWNLSLLSQDEKERVIIVLAERMKNSIYMVAGAKAKEALFQLSNLTNITGEDTIHINFDMVFVWQDIVEIVGGFRREEKGND